MFLSKINYVQLKQSNYCNNGCNKLEADLNVKALRIHANLKCDNQTLGAANEIF